MRRTLCSIAVALLFLAASAAADDTPGDVITVLSMTITDASGKPVTEWKVGQPMTATCRFRLGGEKDTDVIARVAVEYGAFAEYTWHEVLSEQNLPPGEHAASFTFTVPVERAGQTGKLVWAVKGRYFASGRLLSWAVGHHVSEPLDFDGMTIRELRADPEKGDRVRQWVWVRNRQATGTYSIVP